MTGPTPASADAFWHFSLDLYGQPDVAPAALALQDRDGANVNILLLCLWWARSTGHGLSPELLKTLADAAEPWSAGVLGPLRAARNALKSWPSEDHADRAGIEALRRQILQVELEGERIEQSRLVSLLPGTSRAGHDTAGWHGAAAAALTAYVRDLPPHYGEEITTREARLKRFLNAALV